MSRRPADKAAQHQQTIKGLLKLEANKNCADCKRNKRMFQSAEYLLQTRCRIHYANDSSY